jgi:steroid delta-isomerase-like uncharacterized protein
MATTTEEISTVIAHHRDGYNRRDAAALVAHYAEDCVVDSPIAGVHVGRAAIEHTFRTVFSAFPDLRIRTEDLLVAGNRAVWTIKIEGTDTGGFMGLPPTGKPFRLSALFMFTFGSDCRIVHERRMYDFSRLLLHLADEAEPATEGPRLYRDLLEKAQREHELTIAAEIQRALLPQSCHRGTAFEVAATSVPCRAIGGDFFDYFNLSDGAFAFVLGDVAGKGPPAALLAAVLQGIFTANARRSLEPAAAISQANNALVRRAIQARFATVVYAVLEPDGRLVYCNAGHNPPIMLSRSGVRRLEAGGLIIGAFEQATFEEDRLRLEPGDVLVAFSDGITEARNADGEEFGEDRLLSCVAANRQRAPDALLECLLAEVRQFSADTTQSDDLTVLVLRYSGEE